MGSGRHSEILSRLSATVAFLAYLLAGASLALPSEMRCARCARLSATGEVKSGASCPLTYNGRHCHHGHGKTPAKITLCPDGCLRHDGQGGEIPSLVKFLSAPVTLLMLWTRTVLMQEDVCKSPLNPSFPPPTHPPSLSV